jgi:hypothetical protein
MNANADRHFTTFATWTELTDHVRAGYRLYYHPPMDFRPSLLVSATIRRDGTIRCTPVYVDADPFTADIGHLDRFRRIANV